MITRFLGLGIEFRIEGRVLVVDLLQAPESLPSSPRLLGVTASPTMGVGNAIGGRISSPSDRARVQILHLGHRDDAARLGRFDRLGLVGLDLEQLGDLQRFAHSDGRHRGVLGHPAGEDANETQLLHERVDAGLEDLGDQRAGGVGLHLDLFSGGIDGRPPQRVGRQAAQRQRVQQLAHAHARLARNADHGNQAPLGHGPNDQPRNSSSVGGVPSK